MNTALFVDATSTMNTALFVNAITNGFSENLFLVLSSDHIWRVFVVMTIMIIVLLSFSYGKIHFVSSKSISIHRSRGLTDHCFFMKKISKIYRLCNVLRKPRIIMLFDLE